MTSADGTPKRYGARFKDWDGVVEALTWTDKADRDHYASKPDVLGYHNTVDTFETGAAEKPAVEPGKEDWRSWDPQGFWCHCGNSETVHVITHGHSASGVCRCGGFTSVG